MYSVIKNDKLGDHTSIANKLQSKESDFMYNRLMPAMIKNNVKFLTVHDCVLVKQSDSSKAYETFKLTATKYGLISGLSLTNLQ